MNVFAFDQGNAGEALVAGYLSLIFNGEVVKETMRGEGVGALDLQLKFQTFDASAIKTYLQVAVQVKTGESFAKWTPTKNRWRLQNIDVDHIAKWRAANQPVLLVWVRLEPKVQAYWKLITSKTPVETLTISEGHLLTPASRVEIERLLQKHKAGMRRVPGITTREFLTTREVRVWSKDKYSKAKGIHKCCLGTVSVSNYAWRHLTRITRSQSHIQDSLAVLPYVNQILKAIPHQIQTVSSTTEVISGEVFVSRKVLAVYRDVHFSDRGTCVVYIRLDERISYKENWLGSGLIGQKVCQELRLESIYRKTAKK